MEILKIEISKTTFEHYVPAFEAAADDIFNRMTSFLDMAKLEITHFIGDGGNAYLEECPEVVNYITAYICKKAAQNAIPQLDLVLTETGFGVVSNNNVAPASKDRVAALVEQLRIGASEAYDVMLMYLLKYTGWKNTEAAKRAVWSLLYSPAQFHGRWQWKGAAIYREELLQLRPKILLAAANVQRIIGKELYDELLVRLRTGKNEAAYELVADRAQNFMFAFLDDQPLKEFRRILVDTTETLANDLPEYTNSSTYRARHSSGYENKQSDPVFFMS